ncbi:MAG: acetylornithine/succinylornithine family transaminase [Clostridia bacterium]|nr:acetylornithine/succinylornithine family transaminase [Clostridia bacterium]
MNDFETDKKYIANTYNRFPVQFTHGKGSLLCDTNGKEYIDMGSGIGVTSLGTADDGWIAAVTEQIMKLQHTSNLYYTQPCALLAKQLCERTGYDKVFFSNSGAEANECAIKAARKYAAENKDGEHYTIVTLNNSFHGRTLTTLAATGQPKFHEDFQPLTPGFVHATAGSIYELEAITAKYKVAAFMIECIQGEGGVVPLEQSYVSEMFEFAAYHNILTIADEVQTGNGRTGKLYSYMHYGIKPDIITTAKGLAGGLPIGATLLSEKLSGVFCPGDHGSTFGGNPVSCAAANYVLSQIDDGLMEDVQRKGEIIKKELTGVPGVENVTGLGLMIGVKTVKKPYDVVMDCLEHGVLCLTAHDKVRLLPALNIPDELLYKALSVIRSACAS